MAVADNSVLTLFRTQIAAVTVDSFTLGCNNTGTATTVDRDLITYPNKTAGDDTAESFSKRFTRLVIHAVVNVSSTEFRETALNNHNTYYVFDLPNLAANKIYNINNINITMLGKDNDNNDSKTPVGSVQPTITVDEWSDTVTLNYEM